MPKKYRSDIAAMIYEMAEEWYQSGDITEAEFHEYDGCLVIDHLPAPAGASASHAKKNPGAVLAPVSACRHY